MKKNTIIIILIPLLVISCKKELLHSISEEQANDIITVLSDYGIIAEKISDSSQESNTFNIVVEEEDYGLSWNILKENGLPREKIKGLSDVYQKQGLISSSTEEKALLIQAVKGEIEKTLETMDNVIKARVIISVPQFSSNPFSETKELSGVSVLLKIKRGSYVSKDTVKGILLGAISSIDKDRISVEIVEAISNTTKKNVTLTNIGPFILSRSYAKIIYFALITILAALSVTIIFLLFLNFRKRNNISEISDAGEY